MLIPSKEEVAYIKKAGEITYREKIDKKALQEMGINEEEIDYLVRICDAYKYLKTPAEACNNDLRYAIWSLDYLFGIRSDKSYENFRHWVDSSKRASQEHKEKTEHALIGILDKIYKWTLEHEKKNEDEFSKGKDNNQTSKEDKDLNNSLTDEMYKDEKNWKDNEPKLPFNSLSDVISRLANPERGTWHSIDEIEIIEAILMQLNGLDIVLSIWPDFKKSVKNCKVKFAEHKAYFNGSATLLFDLADENFGGLRINISGNDVDMLVDFTENNKSKSFEFSVKL